MAIKTILLCISSPENADKLLRAAAPLARRFGAHLIGLHIHEALVVYPGIAMHIPGEFYTDFNRSQNALSDEIKAVFDKHTRAEDFVSEWRLFKSDSMSAADRLAESARSADLVMIAQDIDDIYRHDQDDVLQKVIRNSGRPVLVVPHDYADQVIGENILLGWSATREATRAAHDLRDIAQKGASIGLLSVGKLGEDTLEDFAINDLAAAYDRHGLKAEVVHRSPQGHKIAEVILHEAFERGADLIVTGAFGHSRSYDLIIGAATRDLLRTATLPILYSK